LKLKPALSAAETSIFRKYNPTSQEKENITIIEKFKIKIFYGEFGQMPKLKSIHT